jgi:GTP-binding protein Era
MNHLLGQKIAITSRKPQTTRHNLLGIDTRGADQAIYVDTPGIHATAGGRAMNRYMVRTALSVAKDVDVVLFLLEAGRFTAEDQLVLDSLRDCSCLVIAVLNKIDLLGSREAQLPVIADIARRSEFREIIPISGLKKMGLDELRKVVYGYLPEGAHLFGEDEVTDRSQRFLVAEIIREKLMRRLGDELPHRLTVALERFHEGAKLVEVDAIIYAERDGQKQIIVGKKGERLREIGRDARLDIERLVDSKVMLRLWVKVRPGWTDDERSLAYLGYQ